MLHASARGWRQKYEREGRTPADRTHTAQAMAGFRPVPLAAGRKLPRPLSTWKGQCPLLRLFGPLRGSVRVLVHPRAVSKLREDQFVPGLACRKSEHGNDGRAVL